MLLKSKNRAFLNLLKKLEKEADRLPEEAKPAEASVKEPLKTEREAEAIAERADTEREAIETVQYTTNSVKILVCILTEALDVLPVPNSKPYTPLEIASAKVRQVANLLAQDVKDAEEAGRKHGRGKAKAPARLCGS